jgi:hypothetical protein
MADEKPYRLTIDLNALNHLGINLYSNIPAVVSEVVANSWDADATEVAITIDKSQNIITIEDDGIGMDRADINERYLKVGFRKRHKDGVRTASGRHVMGRKGIGKLSLFSIAQTVEVYSVKPTADTTDRHAFVMRTGDIKACAEQDKPYFPEPLPTDGLTLQKGTRIVLKELKRSTSITEAFLRKRLARRFSVIGSEKGFDVKVNGKAIGVEDRDFYDKIEFLWYFGDEGARVAALCRNAKHKVPVSDVVNHEAGYKASGWIGTFDERASIDEGNNSIVVLAWGRLAQEDLLKDVSEGGLFTKYLIGEVRADFMDADDLEDIATSDRQRLREDDPRFNLLRQFVSNIVKKEVGANWRKWRREGAEEKAVENPAVKEWFKALSPDHKDVAREMFGTIESLTVVDIDVKKELYKQSILAFESLAFRKDLGALRKIQNVEDLERLASIIGNMDALEAARYHQIVRGRIEVLEKLDSMKEGTLEKVIQRHIFDHLWLLDPSWERASTDAGMEVIIGQEFKKLDAKLTQAEKDSRLDIRYRTAAGKNIVIELKRYDRSISAIELAAQVDKYRGALKKVLVTQFPDQPQQLEFVCLVGSRPTGSDPDAVDKVLAAVDARYITYDDLLKQTRDSYRDYLDASKEIARIEQLVESL